MTLRLAPFLGLVLAIGCGSDDGVDFNGSGGNPGQTGGTSSGGTSSGGTAGSGALGGHAGGAGSSGAGGIAGSGGGVLPAGCGTEPPQSGKASLTHGGKERSYRLYLPPGYNSSQATPLVLNFHGRTAASFGEAAPLQEDVSGLAKKGAAAGFIVVNPQGLKEPDGAQTWNAGLCCSADKGRDDIGFVDALLDELQKKLCVDSKRVYATGLSNGGYMSHALACHRADRFAAVAPVAAANGTTPCAPARPAPVIAFNGTLDGLVWYSLATDSMKEWVKRNGCSFTPKQTFKKGDGRCESYSSCKGGAEVVQCTVDAGGHTWPGGADLSSLGFGKTSKDLIANDILWEFFKKHSLP